MDENPHSDDVERLKQELREELKAELTAELRAELMAELRAEQGSRGAEGDRGPISRRGLMLGGVGAVAGSVLGAVAVAEPAAATTGAMQFGASNNAGGSITSLTSTAGSTLQIKNTGSGTPLMVTSTSAPLVVGYFEASGAATGIHGRCIDTGPGVTATNGDTGPGLLGRGEQGVGVAAHSTSGAQILVAPSSAAAIPAARRFETGSLFSTSGGELWHCVEFGTPGRWRLLSGPQAAGAYVPITPIRVYDSRWVSVIGVTTGVLTTGTTRHISVANARNDSGGVVTVNAVPSGATALTVNMTIVSTVDSGFLSLVPGNVASSNSSSINWNASNQINANGLTIPIDTSTRTVNAICAGGGSTHMILDVTGFFLGR